MRVMTFAGTSAVNKPAATQFSGRTTTPPSIPNGPERDAVLFSGRGKTRIGVATAAAAITAIVTGAGLETASSANPPAYVAHSDVAEHIVSRNAALSTPAERLKVLTQLLKDVNSTNTAAIRPASFSEEERSKQMVDAALEGIKTHFGTMGDEISESRHLELQAIASQMAEVSTPGEAKDLNTRVINKLADGLSATEKASMIKLANAYVDAKEDSRDRKHDWAVGLLYIGVLLSVVAYPNLHGAVSRASSARQEAKQS